MTRMYERCDDDYGGSIAPTTSYEEDARVGEASSTNNSTRCTRIIGENDYKISKKSLRRSTTKITNNNDLMMILPI